MSERVSMLRESHAAQRATVPVSVIIPCFRSGATIERTLASVHTQTAQPLEIILVDDASRDTTTDGLRKIAARRNGVRTHVVELPANRGAGEARNAGLDHATGEFVAFLDADDTWHPRKLELQVAFMREHPDIGLCGHRHRRLEPGEVGSVMPPAAGFERISMRQQLFSNRFVTPSVMFRRALGLRFARGKRYMEDQHLWISAAARGVQIARMNAELAYIHKAPFGMGGLSGRLIAMEQGELDTYMRLYREGILSAPASAGFMAYSLAKFARRILITGTRGFVGRVWK